MEFIAGYILVIQSTLKSTLAAIEFTSFEEFWNYYIRTCQLHDVQCFCTMCGGVLNCMKLNSFWNVWECWMATIMQKGHTPFKYVRTRVIQYYSCIVDLRWSRAIHSCDVCPFRAQKNEAKCNSVHYGFCTPAGSAPNTIRRGARGGRGNVVSVPVRKIPIPIQIQVGILNWRWHCNCFWYVLMSLDFSS